MTFKPLSADFFVSPQLTEEDLREAAARGFKSVISHRPDGEEEGQPSATRMREMAESRGMEFFHLPVVPGAITEADGTAMAEALARLPAPVLAFCRSGARAEKLWEMVRHNEAAPVVDGGERQDRHS